MKEEMITITKVEHDRLVKDSEWLACLDAAGVDNWSGIEEAQEMWRNDNEDQ